jgi:hypothetical protein
MNAMPLLLLATFVVDITDSLVSASKCAVSLRLGTWHCCWNSSADPDTQYAHVSGTISCSGNGSLMGPTAKHLFITTPRSRALLGLHK